MTTTTDLTVDPRPTFRRFTWQEALVNYLPKHRQTAHALHWADRAPTAVILLVTALLALRLRNSAFIDEALYINAGQDYLNHVMRNGPLPDHGRYFSGAPAVYPVLAAALDVVGGLFAVRLFSLLCVLVTVVVVQDLAQEIFASRRTGLLAGAAFGLTGPVTFAGALGTFDAFCILLLAAACWLAVKRIGWASAMGIGLLLSLAVVVKYTVAVFVPVVLVLLVISNCPRALRRAALAVATIATALSAVVVLYGDGLREGIEFTTSTRSALSPTTTGRLLVYLALNVGPLLVLAAVGLWQCRVHGWRRLAASLVLLIGAALLPVAHLRLGEAVSFDKHLAYSALFLAPVVGLALARMSRGLTKLAPAGLVLLVVLIAGVARSGSLYASWPELDRVRAVVEDGARPGIYLSSAADSLKYYTRRSSPQIGWETTFALFSGGESAIRKAVEDNRYQMIVVRSSRSGSAQQDAGQRVLEDAIAGNPRYRLVGDPIPVQEYSSDVWLVFRLTPGSAPGIVEAATP